MEKKLSEHKEFMSLEDVAEYLEVSPRSIYKYIRDGNLPTIRITGKKLLISKEDLIAWLNSDLFKEEGKE